MTFDKNTIIGFILIGIVLFTFSWLNQPTAEQIQAKRVRDSLALVEQIKQQELLAQPIEKIGSNDVSEEIAALPDSLKEDRLTNIYGLFAAASQGEEELLTLENEHVELRFTTKGGRLCYARLKEYKTFDEQPLILFDGDESMFYLTFMTANNRIINTSDLYFTPVKGADGQSLVMKLPIEGGRSLDFSFSLKPDDYFLDFTIQGVGLEDVLAPSTNSIDLTWQQKARRLEKGWKYENQYTGLYYKFAADNVEHLKETKNDEEKISNRIKWIGYKNKFFSVVLIAEENLFVSSHLVSKQFVESDANYLKSFSTNTAVAFDPRSKDPVSFKYFIGPNSYQLLKSYDKGVPSDKDLSLDELVPLGAKFFRPINKYFIVPIFDFLCNRITSMGLVIFLLTLIVKCVLFPLTYKSYMSSAKMRVLRPQVEEITAKYPKKEQAMERQKATMDLYSRAGASPLSGCLPMLVQMPILISLYWLFPTSIELRQQGFLWANDLSTYDDIISWSGNIPLVTAYLGNHISLFCLLMTIVNVVYSKFNMEMTNTGQQQMPGMKMMMYLLPFMFFFMFNQNASGLSYYYFISLLITIIQTLAFRGLINEEKLLLKLENNKKKPKKKSGFMQRLEEAQRMQQAQLKKQQEQKAKNQRKR